VEQAFAGESDEGKFLILEQEGIVHLGGHGIPVIISSVPSLPPVPDFP
jgi:hypothetical protein